MVQINPLGRNWGTLVNWDDLGNAVHSPGKMSDDLLTTQRESVYCHHGRLVGCSYRRHTLSRLAPKITFRADTQPEDRHHFDRFLTHLPGQDLARIYDKWTLSMQRRVLDHEHLPAVRHRPVSSQRDATSEYRRTAAGYPSPSDLIPWYTRAVWSRSPTTDNHSFRSTYPGPEELLFHCSRHDHPGVYIV